MRYEYKTVTDLSAEVLMQLSDDGWELFCSTPYSPYRNHGGEYVSLEQDAKGVFRRPLASPTTR